jgi:hypothetical protein
MIASIGWVTLSALLMLSQPIAMWMARRHAIAGNASIPERCPGGPQHSHGDSPWECFEVVVPPEPRFGEALELTAIFGLAPPLVMLGLGLAGAWVIRGFRSRQ